MFNFKELKLDKREDSENTSSFVGIRRNKNNELEFRLPKGFENFPESDFDATKQLFFKMYRTFKKFENDKSRVPIDERPAEKDNIETMGNAYRFIDKEDNEVLLYSKISVIENLLEAYQDLALDVIERRVGRNEKIDYSKIDQYLHKAIYLPNDVIYLDEMELPRHILRYESATLIDLFCFILHELEIELEQESDERVKDLANRFKEQHLSHDQSLFNEETFENTITTLKDILDDIDKITAYKDEDYWQLYEAIECFLYGELDMKNTHEDGIFWGIQDFWSIWEDMCNTYAFRNFNVIYADTNIIFNGKPVANCTFGGQKIFKKEDFENPFFVEFRDEKRWMRPDLVRQEISGKGVDWAKTLTIRERNNGLYYCSIKPHNQNDVYFLSFLSKMKKYLQSKNNGEYIFVNCSEQEIKKNLNSKFFDIVLLDWKYVSEIFFIDKSSKLDTDISKQLCYEFVLNNKKNIDTIKSQFVIPFFYYVDIRKSKIGDTINNKNFYHRIQANKIEVFKANFQLIQDVYLNHD